MSLADITKRLRAAENACSRPAFSTNLIAVSKLQPDDRVIPVLDQGHRLFGENRVQEAAGKWPSWREKYPGVNVHLLGPLQTNKARQAFGLFDAIHSLDRAKLANALARLAQEAGQCPMLFIQVNTGREPQKAGVLPEGTDKFIAQCRALDADFRIDVHPARGRRPVGSFRPAGGIGRSKWNLFHGPNSATKSFASPAVGSGCSTPELPHAALFMATKGGGSMIAPVITLWPTAIVLRFNRKRLSTFRKHIPLHKTPPTRRRYPSIVDTVKKKEGRGFCQIKPA